MYQNHIEERRRFFRVEDEIYLKIETLTENEYQAVLNQSLSHTTSAISQYRELSLINYDVEQQLLILGRQYPEIVKFLSILNNKLDFIAQQCFNPPTTFNDNDITQVNISASGLSFYSHEHIPINQPLKIMLLLLPERHYIETYGRPQKPSSENQTELAQINLEFEYIHPIDQELMIKHNINKQKQTLREQK